MKSYPPARLGPQRRLQPGLDKARPQTVEALCERVGKLLRLFQLRECAKFFASSGYLPT